MSAADIAGSIAGLILALKPIDSTKPTEDDGNGVDF